MLLHNMLFLAQLSFVDIFCNQVSGHWLKGNKVGFGFNILFSLQCSNTQRHLLYIRDD